MHLMGTWDFSVQQQANAAFITSLASEQYINGLIDAGQVAAVKGVGDTLKSRPNADFTTTPDAFVANMAKAK
nr:hypothetical protein GCM10020063_059920 [Dactylosporangium thailandense]